MAFIRNKPRIRDGTKFDYFYIVENRREGNKVKQKVLEYIGPLEELKAFTMKLYDGVKGKEQSSGTEDDLSFKAYDHGAGMALFWCAQSLGIEAMMDEVFTPKLIKGYPRSRVLLLAMLHRAIDPGSKNSFKTWASTTSLPYYLDFDPEDLTSASFWEAMDGITTQEIEKVWNKLVLKLIDVYGIDVRDFHLDYTNYFTFIDSNNGRCIICKRGHNKQKRDDLRQFSLAVLTSAELLIPIVWDLYEGNRNDKTEFAEFTTHVREQLEKLGIPVEEVTITFDGGSNSEENFKDLGFHFICAHSLVSHKDLYEIDLDKYEKVLLHNGTLKKAYRIDHETFSGVKGTGILTYSKALEEGQRAGLEKDIEKAQKISAELNEKLKKPRSKIFTDLQNAKKSVIAAQKEAEDYNKAIKAEQLEREKEGKPIKGRQKKLKAIPEWDEAKALQGIIENNIFSKGRYLKDFCKVTLVTEEDGARQIIFTVDEAEKEAYCKKYYGKKLTVTDRTDWTTEDILSEYCSQECIENGIFRVSKDTSHFSVRPQFHWTDDKIRVHVFICLAAIVIAEALRHNMELAGINIPKHRMLDRLNEIHDGWIYQGNNKVKRVVERLNGIHAKLWGAALKIRDSLTTS